MILEKCYYKTKTIKSSTAFSKATQIKRNEFNSQSLTVLCVWSQRSSCIQRCEFQAPVILPYE